MSNHEEALERDWKTRYVLGELPEPERSRFEDHFFDCAECADAVKTSYLLVRGVEATLKRPVFGAARQASAPAAPREKVRPVWSWGLRALSYAAMLCLAAGTGFEYFALQRARAPQAVASFFVPPQAKGGAERIALPESGGFVELELDLQQQAPRYDWEIRPAGSGRAVMSGAASAAANDLVLKLLLPVDQLRPGRYEADVTVPPGPPAVYPFEVVAAQKERH